jgi:hypothetical protein
LTPPKLAPVLVNLKLLSGLTYISLYYFLADFLNILLSTSSSA